MKYPVNIDIANKTVNNIKKYSDQIGEYAATYKLPPPKLTEILGGVLVASCDGVGTKTLVAQYAQNKYQRNIDSIGIDCVAMVVNDLICKGAVPQFFLDYYATSSLKEHEFYQVLSGIHEGCEQSGMQLIGGETAELNGIIQQNTFDICGFGVGIQYLPLPKYVSKGDAVIGLFSSGLHSNGFSLINQGWIGGPPKHWILETYDEQFINQLLEPTKIYVDDIKELKSAGVDIHALAHITGGGLSNIDRVIPDDLEVNWLMSEGYFSHNELFTKIQKDYNVDYKEMRTTFNCGVGMAVIMASESVKNIPNNDFIILGELK